MLKTILRAFIFLIYVGNVNALHSKNSTVLFESPDKLTLIAFLDSQFDGNLFPGTFGHQDEAFINILKKYCEKKLDQEDIFEFVSALAPYYAKNIEDQQITMPLKYIDETKIAVLKKQDRLLKYFYDKFKLQNPYTDAYAYFQTIATWLSISAKI
jgi:hypothetical protein